tara:strand:- start:1254 stop:1613 length:360 start_codon:yes stop_codon:yes gene_type:complete
MKLTKKILKQIIKEELKKIIEEGKKYTNIFSPDSAAIYYVDESPNPGENPLADLQQGKAAIKRLPDQAVVFGSPRYKQMKSYYESQNFEFDGKGMTEKVRPPNGTEFVEFVFRYVETKG